MTHGVDAAVTRRRLVVVSRDVIDACDDVIKTCDDDIRSGGAVLIAPGDYVRRRTAAAFHIQHTHYDGSDVARLLH